MLEKIFKLSENRTTVRTEILAGLTTFMTMAYILAVNPGILSVTGMDKGAVFTATALASVIATLVMALVARLPFALAPGMGLNAFFAFTVCLGMGYSWEFALTAVFIEGLLFIILTAVNVREAIVKAIPTTVKNAISVGIGLFISFIGLRNAGIVVNNEATSVTLGNMADHNVWIALGGLILTGALLAAKVRGALLIGILGSTLVGVFLGVTHLPDSSLISLPPSLEPIFFRFDWSHFNFDLVIVVFTFLFIDMFDTVGTLVGVSAKAGMIDEKGNIPRVKQALFADAIGTTAGAILGTSTVTTYVESASGVAEGGRTGLTAFTVAVLFALALFLAPVFTMVPASATAPALILVGLFMMSPILKINFDDFTESIPAFLTIIMMPLTYSIAEGIVFGVLSYVLLKLLTGKRKEITLVMYLVALLFVIKFFV
jgi:adenine/guanine/hypoxanthine permease